MHLRLPLLALSTLSLAGCEDAPITAGAQPRTMIAQRIVPWGEPCAPPVGEPIVWVDPCPGQVTCALPDLDQDGEVDTADMLIILEVWETYESSTWNRCDC